MGAHRVVDLSARTGFFESSSAGSEAPDWLVAGIVESWELDPARTTVVLAAVSENATFVVSSGGVPVLVTRVARPGYMTSADEFESELAWVSALATSEYVRVPRGIRTHDGSYVAVILDDRGRGWWCVSFSYVDGGVLQDVTDPLPYYREIGRTTAHLHDHTGAWEPPAGFRRHSWATSDMVGPTCRWGMWQDVAFRSTERDLVKSAELTALATLGSVVRSPGDWGLIHADLRPSNIMIDEAGLTVIDFDDSGYCWYMYDFAAALSLVEHLDAAPTMAHEWIDGYAEVRPLTRADVQVACALSMIRRLQMLGWTTTHREDALPADLWAARRDGTLVVAEKFLRSPTWLMDD